MSDIVLLCAGKAHLSTTSMASLIGTLRQICRPGQKQREMFSGHKQRHGLKFQHVMLPNGIVCHSFRPFPGSRPDASMYGVSQVDAQLAAVKGSDGRQLAIYGDAAYPVRP